jgi:hypothetical protein
MCLHLTGILQDLTNPKYCKATAATASPAPGTGGTGGTTDGRPGQSPAPAPDTGQTLITVLPNSEWQRVLQVGVAP